MCNCQSSVYLKELNGVLHRLVATAINSIHNNNNNNNNNNNSNNNNGNNNNDADDDDDDDDDDNKKHKRCVYSWVSRKISMLVSFTE